MMKFPKTFPSIPTARFAVLMLAGWLLAYLGDEYLVPASAGKPWLIVLADPGVHGLIAFLMVSPVFVAKPSLPFNLFVAAVLAGVLIDADHAVAAGSIMPADMLSLSVRPASHSLAFAAFAGLLCAWFFPKHRLTAFYCMFISLASHIMRDALGPTPWLYPSDMIIRIPQIGYFGLCMALSFFSLWKFRDAPASA